MQTEQPISGSHATTRRRKSLAALQKLIRQLSRVAGELRAQGRHDVAEPLYLRALELAELFCGGEDVAALCNNLAALYNYMGRFDEAERLYLRALPLMEQSLGIRRLGAATRPFEHRR
jgi:tetratricopeptide (TPR) repeat protein